MNEHEFRKWLEGTGLDAKKAAQSASEQLMRDLYGHFDTEKLETFVAQINCNIYDDRSVKPNPPPI